MSVTANFNCPYDKLNLVIKTDQILLQSCHTKKAAHIIRMTELEAMATSSRGGNVARDNICGAETKVIRRGNMHSSNLGP